MKRILVTSDFCKGAKQLVKCNKVSEVNSLRTVLILLANNKKIPSKYRDHQLTGKDFRELHISGDVLLLYRNEVDSNTLVVSLKLANITDHKGLNRDASRNDYAYEEVSTQDLHNITSSDHKISDLILYDILESVSDYAGMWLSEGYVSLGEYYIEDTKVHAIYSYYEQDDPYDPIDSVDLIIDLSKYNLNDRSQHQYFVEQFATDIVNYFE